MKARSILVGGFLACVQTAFAASPDSWTAEPPLAIVADRRKAIPAADHYEVVASMRANAESELQKKQFVVLSEAQARKFTGPYYSCPNGKRPYLVRALFGFAGTGAFYVYRSGQEICVSHESLGTEFVSARSALIVNLDFDPTAIYVTVSIIQ